MARRRSIDGTETGVVTLRLPLWLMDRVSEVANKEGVGMREWMREAIFMRFKGMKEEDLERMEKEFWERGG